MILDIKKFIILLFIIVVISFYGIYIFFSNQENNIASVILKDLKNNITETSYTLSKNIKKSIDIFAYRALLDRISANYDYISSIVIIDKDEIILSTNPSITALEIKKYSNNEFSDKYNELKNQNILQEELRFFEGKNLKTFTIVYILDQDEIKSYFVKNQKEFLLYFALLPIFITMLLLIISRYYILRPLDQLRQYAYHNEKIPKAFKLKEFEAIRKSMVDSFSRLEKEKKELYLMARTDSLSGLANRNSLHEYLNRVIPISKRKKEEFAFLFLDIDHFKTINDSLGHNIGDELLQNIAKSIQKIIRPNDFVARIGGDEFVILIQDYKNYNELSNIVQRIQNYLSKPWNIKNNPINISCSIGVAIYPKNGEDFLELMKNADIAMYQAKKLGRNQSHYFTNELNEQVQNNINLDKNMRLALENNEYQLYYQAKMDLKANKIVGVEALIRWISPSKGMISPDTFIPLAEENGFIKELGQWVMNEAIEQYLRWKEKGLDIRVSINASSKQLSDSKFVDSLINKIKENSIEPSKIDVEITEYMFIEQSIETFSYLKTLHDFGITISLDDFGTGYSSLSYLKKFPIDYLKIDKAFLDDYNSEDGSIFLETIIKLGQMLKIKVIAEGVETQEQVEYLKNNSCEQCQGYYFSKPISSDEFEKFYISYK